MRTFLTSGLFLASAACALLSTSSASAQDAGAPLANCDPTNLSLLCSNGTFKNEGAKHEAASSDPLPIGIDTGWMPSCSSDPPHCDKSIQVRLDLGFDPPTSGGTIYKVEMHDGAFLDARWPDVDFLTLSLATGRPSPGDGKFQVTHTLTPNVGLYISALGFTTEINMDPSFLLTYIQGNWNYLAQNTSRFPIWGFDKVEMDVNGTDLANSKLFSVTFDQMASLVGSGGFDQYLTGELSVNALTKSKFSFQTSKVVVTGCDQPINHPAGTCRILGQDADFMDVQVHAEGIMRYSGTIEVMPVVTITSIGGMGISLSLPINQVKYSTEYENQGMPISFKIADVHIKLPNVFVPTTPLDFGKVATGAKSPDKSLLIENTGELGAILEFTSDNSQFKVGSTSTQMGPEGSEFELKVRFQPTKGGSQVGNITVKSNDPDSPEQIVQVMGYGEGPDIEDPEDDAGVNPGEDGGEPGATPNASSVDPESDGGCGCRTTSAPTSGAALAAGLLGLGLAMRRRRRH